MREMMAYYDRRVPEYDDSVLRDIRGAAGEVEPLHRALAGLPAARMLEVACATGLFTRPLTGDLVCLGQSAAMLERTRLRRPEARFVRGDALHLPFADGTFERVVTSHFYGHLSAGDRVAFLVEAARMAPELVVVDSALNDRVVPEEWQDRLLSDGSRYHIYKRHFTPGALLAELGGGAVLFDGRWFVAVRSPIRAGPAAPTARRPFSPFPLLCTRGI